MCCQPFIHSLVQVPRVASCRPTEALANVEVLDHMQLLHPPSIHSLPSKWVKMAMITPWCDVFLPFQTGIHLFLSTYMVQSSVSSNKNATSKLEEPYVWQQNPISINQVPESSCLCLIPLLNYHNVHNHSIIIPFGVTSHDVTSTNIPDANISQVGSRSWISL